MESFSSLAGDGGTKGRSLATATGSSVPTDDSTSITRSRDAASVGSDGINSRDQASPNAGSDTTEVESIRAYPQLINTEPESPKDITQTKDDEDEDVQFDLSKAYPRGSSPSPVALHRDRGTFVSKVGDEGVLRMHKFTLYETANYYYIIGSDSLDAAFRILKIDRTAELGELSVTEDDIVYSRKETYQILNAIDEGNRTTGGLKLKTAFWGLLGFIRFTGPFYMVCVTKRSQIAMIGGHYIYQVDKTELIALQTISQSKTRRETHIEESRFLQIFGNLDLTRSFYFSYSYDITRTLQYNIMKEREALYEGLAEPPKVDHNDMFVWNQHLLEPAKRSLRKPLDWCIAIIHGHIDQSGLSIWGRMVYLTIIARRSRFFAGARYLKRGANDLGYVANDVETEQIVSDMITTSFHAPGPRLFANSKHTSYVQHRGSIPLHWMQDSTGVNPKPDINLSVGDPFFSAAALHFDDLFQRYGAPVYVLNLIKIKERTPRESKLGKEYWLAIKYLNQFLPEDKQIRYRAWDMSRASKSRDGDVIGNLEEIAGDILPQTQFFQNADDPATGLKLQSGVVRTNCIDCLDRTNAAQFVIGKKALGYQLKALGVIDEPDIPYDSDAINQFTNMWHDHGDTIAIQYGGSHLVNTVSTYRKINQWTSQSRDMVESFKRYYNNSFLDAQRQEAYNLFLGTYVFAQGQPMLWDLSTDYYLHHSNPRSTVGEPRPSYRHWYTDEYLTTKTIPPSHWPHELVEKPLKYFDDYWVEYYRPLALTSFKKLYSFKIHSNYRSMPATSTQGKYDFSPFTPRTGADVSTGDVKGHTTKRKGVKIIAPSDEWAREDRHASIDARLAASAAATTTTTTTTTATATATATAVTATATATASRAMHIKPAGKPPKPSALNAWIDVQHQNHARRYTGIIKETSFQVASSTPSVPKLPSSAYPPGTAFQPNKAELAAQAFTTLVANSLAPTVPETEEYVRYIDHPSNIPLVVSSDIDYAKAPTEFLDYLSRIASDPSPSSSLADTPQHKAFQVYAGLTDDDRGALSLTLDERAELSLDEYAEYVESGGRDEPLTVLEEDGAKKRYKAYRQWLRGKSLFKQRPVGGETV